MADYRFRTIAARAFRESMEAIRFDTPVRIMTQVGTPLLAGAITLATTGNWAWTALISLIAVLLLGTAFFIGKLWSVPLAIAGEANKEREAVEADLGKRIAALEEHKANQRDPDGIYQFGQKVATAIHPTVIPNEVRVYFKKMSDAVNLNLSKPFEWREWILIYVGCDSQVARGLLGSMQDIAHNSVVCEIEGRRS